MLSPSDLPVLLVLLLIDVSVVISIVTVGGAGEGNTSLGGVSSKVTSCVIITESVSRGVY